MELIVALALFIAIIICWLVLPGGAESGLAEAQGRAPTEAGSGSPARQPV